jgi:regulator of cell morphogenesis and NO signaling
MLAVILAQRSWIAALAHILAYRPQSESKMNTIIDFGEKKLSEIVLGDVRTIAVFNEFGIDYCCGGKRSLALACKQKGVDVAAVEARLVAASQAPATEAIVEDYAKWPVDELALHIVHKHHRYVETRLPELLRLIDKVAERHGPEHAELLEIKSIFHGVAEELTGHMKKEELILFPWIKRLGMVERGEIDYVMPPFGSVANPIQMMEREHVDAGDGMARIRVLTNHYVLPAGACMSYWQTYEYLKEFEADLHLHVHLENNLLFPQAIALESQFAQSHAR